MSTVLPSQVTGRQSGWALLCIWGLTDLVEHGWFLGQKAKQTNLSHDDGREKEQGRSFFKPLLYQMSWHPIGRSSFRTEYSWGGGGSLGSRTTSIINNLTGLGDSERERNNIFWTSNQTWLGFMPFQMINMSCEEWFRWQKVSISGIFWWYIPGNIYKLELLWKSRGMEWNLWNRYQNTTE